MNVSGRIIGYNGLTLHIAASFTDGEFLVNRRVEDCTVILEDGRAITAQQRKYIYAMLRDIGIHTGHEVEFLKEYFKADCIAKTGENWFSLSDCSMTQANSLIEILIQFCIEWEVPTRDNILEFAPSIDKYIYFCLKNKVCCVSRQKGAELHHVDRVGIGRNRREIAHSGMRAMPLLRHYHDEAHTTGQLAFESKYHIYGIALTPELCRVWEVRE